jgi:hypothetical protein
VTIKVDLADSRLELRYEGVGYDNPAASCVEPVYDSSPAIAAALPRNAAGGAALTASVRGRFLYGPRLAADGQLAK